MVVGATAGLGHAVVNKLIEKGHHLLVAAAELSELEAKARTARWPHTVLLRQVDTPANDNLWKTLVDQVLARFRRLDNLVYISEAHCLAPLAEIDADVLSKHIDCNTKGALFAAQAAARQMSRHQRGRLVYVYPKGSPGAPEQICLVATTAAAKSIAESFSAQYAEQNISASFLTYPSTTPRALADSVQYELGEKIINALNAPSVANTGVSRLWARVAPSLPPQAQKLGTRLLNRLA
jgi:NADP-dependent 3-hydroxy acid dehydrogenase YdfG